MSREDLIGELKNIVGDRFVLVEKEDVIVYEQDGSIFQVMPEIVVLPSDVEQVSNVVKLAKQAAVPIVPRGSGTGLARGAVLDDGAIVWLGGEVPDTPGYDLCGVFVGSEGTLGVVTKVAVKLMQTRESVRTLLAIFDEMDNATQTVVDITAAGIIPAALEMMDRTTIEAVERGAPVGFPRDAEAVLIVEVEGLIDHSDRSALIAREICHRNGAREVKLAADESERQ